MTGMSLLLLDSACCGAEKATHSVREGLGAAFMSDMMMGWNVDAPLVRVTLLQEILRTLVLIRPVGTDGRPTVPYLI